MSLEHKIIFLITFIVVFFSGWVIGKMSHDKGGTIRIETNEDGTRDVIRFILDMDLEDIRKEKHLRFKVEDFSKKSQG